MTDREKLAQAFKALRRKGYTARMNFGCCSGCAWYELGEKGKAGRCVFFNQQNRRAFDTRGDIARREAVFLQWDGDPHEIIAALEAEGLAVEWKGREQDAIVVVPKNLFDRPRWLTDRKVGADVIAGREGA